MGTLRSAVLGRAVFFFFNDTATTEIYTLSLHDALPIYGVTSSGQLHTNFKLSPAGEELALVDPEGTVISGFDPAYPPQATNVSYGLRESNAPLGVFGFMATPTPGGMNSTARVGFTQPPTFSTPGDRKSTRLNSSHW